MRAVFAVPLLLAFAIALVPLASAQEEPTVDLDLTLSPLESEYHAGSAGALVFKVTNNGTANATGIVVTLEMPDGVTFLDGHMCTTTDGTSATCDGEPLPPDSFFSYTFNVRFEEEGDFTIDGSASATQPDANEADNVDAITVTVGEPNPNPPVEGVSCAPTATGVLVSWGVNDFVHSYNVYRADVGGEPQLLASGIVGQSHLDTTAEANATYEYYVTATRENGESPLGDPCTVTAIPEFPTLLVGALACVGAVAAYVALRRRG